jgi:hypothetical protein
MLRWRLGAFALVVHLAIAPIARAQDTPPPPTEGGNAGDAGTATSSETASPEPPPADQPFKRLLPNFWHDLTHFPSIDTAIVLGIGASLSGIAAKNDEYLTEHAAAGGEDPAFSAGGGFGSGWVQAGIGVGTYAFGRLAKQERAAHIGADLIRSQILSGVITGSIKVIAQRERPTGDGNSHSFPSGHASATWTTATVLWRHLGWKVGGPASLLAAFTSASRLQQNAHYMSDILFGAALGVASGRTVTFGHGERAVTVAPAPVAGGVAIMFTLGDRR